MSSDKNKLASVLSSIKKIETYTDGLTLDIFIDRSQTTDATLIHLVNLGKNLNTLSPNLKEQFPDLPIASFRKMQNSIEYSYDSLDKELVWNTIQKDLPALKKQILEIQSHLNAAD